MAQVGDLSLQALLEVIRVRGRLQVNSGEPGKQLQGQAAPPNSILCRIQNLQESQKGFPTTCFR